ncbi:MAG: FliH/SctL family protein [Acidobacteriota bacterium]
MARPNVTGRVLRGEASRELVAPFEPTAVSDSGDVNPEQAGYDAGFARGVEEGREAGERETAGLRLRLARALEKMATLSRERVQLHEKDLVRLALAMASRLVRRQVRQEQELVRRTFKEALETFSVGRPLQVRVHPADADALWMLSPELAGMNEISIRQDRSLEPGDLVVTDGATEVDARISSQIAALARAAGVPAPDEAGGQQEKTAGGEEVKE